MASIHIKVGKLCSRTVIESGVLLVFLDGMRAPNQACRWTWGVLGTSGDLCLSLSLSSSLSFHPPSISLSPSLPHPSISFFLSLLPSYLHWLYPLIFLWKYWNNRDLFLFFLITWSDPFHLWFSQFPSKLNIKQICLLTADPRSGRACGPPPGGGELSRQRWRGDRMEPAPGPWGRPKVVSLPSRQPKS